MFPGHFLLLFKASISFPNLPFKLLKHRLPLFYFYLGELLFARASVQSGYALYLFLHCSPAAYGAPNAYIQYSFLLDRPSSSILSVGACYFSCVRF